MSLMILSFNDIFLLVFCFEHTCTKLAFEDITKKNKEFHFSVPLKTYLCINHVFTGVACWYAQYPSAENW